MTKLSWFILGIACIIYLIQFLVFKLIEDHKSNKENNIVKINGLVKNELNKLEEKLLELADIDKIYAFMVYWISNRFLPSFICVLLPNSKGKYKILQYKESIPSKKKCSDLFKLKRQEKNSKSFVHYPQFGSIIEFSIQPEGVGYLLIGERYNNPKEGILEVDMKLLPPISRILSKSLMAIDVDKAQKEKNQLKYAFSRYVSSDFVEKISLDPEMLHIGGENKTLTVMFTDLRGFTTLSDELETKQLVKVLNMYLNEMSEVIIAMGGTIDKFEGDAILSFFGVQRSMKDHAQRCCRAALRMQKMERILNAQLQNEKLIKKDLFTRFGINTGDMIIGNIGSLKRMEYTIIGSNVNIAARIEEINKKYETSILISENTYDIVKDDFIVKYIDTVQLRGLKKEIKIFELIDEKVSAQKYNVIPSLQTVGQISMPDIVESVPELEEV